MINTSLVVSPIPKGLLSLLACPGFSQWIISCHPLCLPVYSFPPTTLDLGVTLLLTLESQKYINRVKAFPHTPKSFMFQNCVIVFFVVLNRAHSILYRSLPWWNKTKWSSKLILKFQSAQDQDSFTDASSVFPFSRSQVGHRNLHFCRHPRAY